MKWVKSIRRWTARSLRVMILGAALVGPASALFAQAPSAAASKLPSPNYARSLTFHLPLRIDAEQRINLKEIQLWFKTPTTGWTLKETTAPYVEQFICQVPRDGEYWYSLVMVDRAGRCTPPDVTSSPPLQRVIVDSSAPMIQVKACTGPDGSQCIRCTVDDANPDLTTLKAVCRIPGGDVALEAVPQERGMFRVNRAEHLKHVVVVSVSDFAKNNTTKEVNIAELVGSLASVAVKTLTPAAPAPITLAARSEAEISPPLPLPRGEGSRLLEKMELPSLSAKVELPSLSAKVELKSGSLPLAPTLPDRMDLPTPPALGNSNSPPGIPGPESQETPVKLATGSEAQARRPGPVQLINTTHASVEYRIDQVGPSGIGKVEIYMTSDDGQTWRRWGENVSKRSPAEINLPGDGVFGIRIVTTNGNGFGGKAPIRGDAPHCVIEVDTTSPFVQLRSTELLPGTGEVDIRWTVSDKNLSATPVNLFYRTQADGPWQMLARELKNDGSHRWAFPREGSSQMFFKIEVTDQAGNMSQDVTRQALVIDTTEPRAVVVGVVGSGAAARP